MDFTSHDYDWYSLVCSYLDTTDIVSMSVSCIEMYMRSHGTLSSRHVLYKQTDAFILSVLKQMNYTSSLIQEIHFNCKITNVLMFEYVMLCYENWNILLEHKSKLKIPNNPLFLTFMTEHNIDIDKIIPDRKINYTHVHRPTKTYAYYMSLV